MKFKTGDYISFESESNSTFNFQFKVLKINGSDIEIYIINIDHPSCPVRLGSCFIEEGAFSESEKCHLITDEKIINRLKKIETFQ